MNALFSRLVLGALIGAIAALAVVLPLQERQRSEDAAALQALEDRLTAALDGINTSVGDTLAALPEPETGLSDRLEAIGVDLDALASRLEETAADTSADDIAQIRAEIADLRDALETRLDALSDAVTLLEPELPTIEVNGSN